MIEAIPVWPVHRVVNFLMDTDIEAEENSESESTERQEEGLQVLFDGKIDSSDSESDKLDAIEDNEGDS